MFYTELIKQAADMAGLSNAYSPALDSTKGQKAFEVLRASLLAMNSDDRLTFAVEDVVLDLREPKLALTPDPDYIAEPGEQVLLTGYPVEVAPAYVAGSGGKKFEQVRYEDFAMRPAGGSAYALRVEYRKATLFLSYGGELKIGLKKPLDMPTQITDEAKLIGSALNLLKYKLATELLAAYGMPSSPEIEQKYGEMIGRHDKVKDDILAPPALEW